VISGDETGPDIKVQVKTVSGYSKTRSITPLFPGWDHLYLVYLGRNLMPEGFRIVTDNDIFRGRLSLTGLTMRKPSNLRSGSLSIPWDHNRVEELMRAVQEHTAEPVTWVRLHMTKTQLRFVLCEKYPSTCSISSART
jgi:hypothetical protein